MYAIIVTVLFLLEGVMLFYINNKHDKVKTMLGAHHDYNLVLHAKIAQLLGKLDSLGTYAVWNGTEYQFSTLKLKPKKIKKK